MKMINYFYFLIINFDYIFLFHLYYMISVLIIFSSFISMWL